MRSRLISSYKDLLNEKLNIPIDWPEGHYELLMNKSISILTIPEDQIFTDYFAGYLKTDLLIFASKHSSSAGKKALLVHTTGIWNEANDYGGNSYELAFAPVKELTYMFHKIQKLAQERDKNEYWIGIEVTHHGPTSLSYPVLFAETGGTEEEWEDQSACNIIADAIISLIDSKLKNLIKEDKIAFVGFGGGHYAPAFLKKIRQDNYAIGHISPKYSHGKLNEKMIIQAYEKTLAKNKVILIDKKGSRLETRNLIIEIAEKNHWEWKYT